MRPLQEGLIAPRADILDDLSRHFVRAPAQTTTPAPQTPPRPRPASPARAVGRARRPPRRLLRAWVHLDGSAIGGLITDVIGGALNLFGAGVEILSDVIDGNVRNL